MSKPLITMASGGLLFIGTVATLLSVPEENLEVWGLPLLLLMIACGLVGVVGFVWGLVNAKRERKKTMADPTDVTPPRETVSLEDSSGNNFGGSFFSNADKLLTRSDDNTFEGDVRHEPNGEK